MSALDLVYKLLETEKVLRDRVSLMAGATPEYLSWFDGKIDGLECAISFMEESDGEA